MTAVEDSRVEALDEKLSGIAYAATDAHYLTWFPSG